MIVLKDQSRLARQVILGKSLLEIEACGGRCAFRLEQSASRLEQGIRTVIAARSLARAIDPGPRRVCRAGQKAGNLRAEIARLEGSERDLAWAITFGLAPGTRLATELGRAQAALGSVHAMARSAGNWRQDASRRCPSTPAT